MKVKAYVNGVPCTIYHYTQVTNDCGANLMYCACKFEAYSWTVPVIADLVEVRIEE